METIAVLLTAVALIAASVVKKLTSADARIATHETLDKAYTEIDDEDWFDYDLDPTPWTRCFHLILSGVTFANGDGTSRQQIIDSLRIGDGITFVREPYNQHDKNAIAVYAGPRMVGYISRGSSSGIARKMDTGIHHNAIVLSKFGRVDDQSSNIVMRVRVYE